MTETTTPATAITGPEETWETARYRMETSVKLTGAPDIHTKGHRYSPYSIRFDFRRTEGSPWRPGLITIYATKQYPHGGSALIGTPLYAHTIEEVPAWLADITERATPKDTQ